MSGIWLICRREWFLPPRRLAYTWQRLMLPALGVAVLLTAYHLYSRQFPGTLGRVLLQHLAVVVLLFLPYLAAYQGARTVQREQTHGTLLLLHLAPVSARQWLAGFWLAGCGSVGLLCLAMLPLLAICLSLGGVAWWQPLILLVLGLTMAACGSALGIMLSTRLRLERRAHILAIISLMFWEAMPATALLVLPELARLLKLTLSDPALSIASAISPLASAWYLCDGQQALILPTVIACALRLALALFMLYLAGRGWLALFLPVTNRLPKRQTRQPKPMPQLLLNLGAVRNPLLHYEVTRRVRQRGRWRWLFFTLGSGLLLGWLVGLGLGLVTGNRVAGYEQHLFLSILGLGLVGLLLLTLDTWRSATEMLSTERRDGVLEPLLLSHLSDEELVSGKLNPQRWHYLPIFVLVAGVSLIGLPLNNHPGEYAMAVIFPVWTWLAMLLCFPEVGLWATIRWPNLSLWHMVILFLAQVLILGVLSSVLGMLTAPFSCGMSIVAAPLLTPLMVRQGLAYYLHDSFRRELRARASKQSQMPAGTGLISDSHHASPPASPARR